MYDQFWTCATDVANRRCMRRCTMFIWYTAKASSTQTVTMVVMKIWLMK